VFVYKACNRTYTASNGFIVSPRYPAEYPVNSFCEIIIQTTPGYKLSLFFSFIDIEPHSRCIYDYLQVSGLPFCQIVAYLICMISLLPCLTLLRSAILETSLIKNITFADHITQLSGTCYMYMHIRDLRRSHTIPDYKTASQ